jgi:hypothetical protein
VVPPNPIQINPSGDIAIDVLPGTTWNYKLTRTYIAYLLIIIYYWFINQWLMNLDWVVQTFIKFKYQLKLKITWNVHEINVHLRLNWDLYLIEGCAA